MNRQFGALGGLAIVLIVVNHSIYLGTIIPEQWGYSAPVGWVHTFLSILQSFGVFAVPTFLFISGSFVSYAAQGQPPRLSFKFILSTLRHILLPYLVWSIIFYILVYFASNEKYTPFEYIKNLLVGYPYNFVPILVFYYLLSPLLIRIGKSNGLTLIAVFAIYQLVLLNILNPGILGFTFPGWSHFFAPLIIRTTLAKWGIFFPLGLVYGLHAKKLNLWLTKFVWVVVGATTVLFVVDLLDVFSVISAPMAGYICPVMFMLILPVIKRDFIPLVRQLERVGRRTYGVYLTHLIILNLVLLGIKYLAPWMFNLHLLLFPLLLILGLWVPLIMMESVATGLAKQVYRYVFG
jgi:fucose 4-O-acetylase-like acetyltransferase